MVMRERREFHPPQYCYGDGASPLRFAEGKIT